jgi:hypothetical protein
MGDRASHTLTSATEAIENQSTFDGRSTHKGTKYDNIYSCMSGMAIRAKDTKAGHLSSKKGVLVFDRLCACTSLAPACVGHPFVSHMMLALCAQCRNVPNVHSVQCTQYTCVVGTNRLFKHLSSLVNVCHMDPPPKKYTHTHTLLTHFYSFYYYWRHRTSYRR